MTTTTTTITPRFVQIFTQLRENYGAHDWDGVGNCPQRWKNKSGSVYILGPDVDVDKFKGSIEYADNYFEEFVAFVEETTEPYSGLEAWDTPLIVSPSPKGGFFMELFQEDEFSSLRKGIKSKKTVTEIDQNGKHLSATVEYCMEDGQTLDREGLNNYFKVA
jgi:hypothetical protein